MTLFSRITTAGSLWLLTYPFTIISAAALLAEYGFVGSSVLFSTRSPVSASPYTCSTVSQVSVDERLDNLPRPWRRGRIS